MAFLRQFLGVALLGSAATLSTAQSEIGAARVTPNLVSNIDRPLRYRPDGADFVIENGAEFFNRPLYGGNTAFRVDGGDKPEFVLYLPGRGGNLRLGVSGGGEAKWLHALAHVESRYRPGELVYEIRDPLLGAQGRLELIAVAYADVEGLAVRVTAHDVPAGVRLLWAYGGVNGQRGKRDGDIGTESVPISQWFQLRPEFCRGNTIALSGSGFAVHGKPGTIAGVTPAGAVNRITDAAQWNDPAALAKLLSSEAPSSESAAPAAPIVAGQVALVADVPFFLSLQRLAANATDPGDLDTYREVTAPRPAIASASANPAPDSPAAADHPLSPADLPGAFAAAEAHFAALRARVAIDTPDPFLNAAVGALNVAGDAVWDGPQQGIMHGAIAWRTRLLGWRGPYLLDALGWHERARKNFAYWFDRQNTGPIPTQVPPPDEKANLARNEAGLHTNGDLSNSHYDMNLVFIDALFRHLAWTGDLEFARRAWPVIERHLAWERRLFRREFGPEKLPLYEAYAAIWASDDLQYSGGGTAHASAYNYFENRQAARLARLIGADPAPYDHEADLIARGMRRLLWLPDGGFAENKDWLGRQRVHPDAALWTFYHTIDSEVPTSQEAWQMADKLAREIPHLPVRGPGVPDGLLTLSESDWMPYDWSINNVVMAEAVHAALALWEAGRLEEAFAIAKGSVLAAMYLGISPGNVGSMSYLDVYRRESQRDFADGGGVLSRALVEGLFGLKPDALAGELRVSPGWPVDWDHARIAHPDLAFAYRRHDHTEEFTVTQHWQSVEDAGGSGASRSPLRVRLRIAARSDGVASVAINGASAPWRVVEDSIGRPRIEVVASAAAEQTIVVAWSGAPLRLTSTSAGPAFSRVEQGSLHWLAATQPVAPDATVAAGAGAGQDEARDGGTYEPVDLTSAFNDRVTQIFRNAYRAPRSPFVSLALPKQGLGGWAGGVNKTASLDDTGLRAAAARDGGVIRLAGGVPLRVPGEAGAKNVVFTSQWDNYPREATVPLAGRAQRVWLLLAGSTNPMQSHFENGEIVVTYADGSTATLALVNPTNWWPIEQDYFIDDFQFRRPGALPIRVDLKTGRVRELRPDTFKGSGGNVPGGAATVLSLALDPTKPLQSLVVRATANDVVVGLMAATLVRPATAP